MKEPKVQVGILFEPQIEFVLLNPYRMDGTEVSGKQVVTYDEGKILWNGRRYDELLFEPQHEQTDAFELLDVTIGINFHWERKEDQRFLGALKIIVENGKLTGINVIHVEDYLTSVISSEMSATASLELLKAHAVISRSWLLAQIQKNKEITEAQANYSAFTQTDEELIRWYDREDHTRFDVCADDHCQRYQGITRASTDIVKQAISATRGQVLTSDGKICDARFSKCCGGAFEEFQYCWEDIKYPYLAQQRDSKTHATLPDLTQEVEADRWIRTSPEAFCNTTDKKILSQVLNNYDQETTDFYRWKVEYTQEELSALILKRSGIDYGQIIDLIPIARGTSGRLWKLKIVGTKRTLTIGKELEIRRTLSTSHLYSSAFVVDKEELSAEGIPGRFILTEAFCNTTDKKILSQVLNNYDQETTDFYRWKVEYTQEELSALILKRSGIDYGQIIDLIPIARGTSGRLWKLKIVGTKRTLTIGKELEIRRTLSTSHLYSSAFVVDKEELSAEGIPGRFILTGAGWGHGVGLCQIGAAVMGEQGYKYDAILLHYYIGASIDKLYE